MILELAGMWRADELGLSMLGAGAMLAMVAWRRGLGRCAAYTMGAGVVSALVLCSPIGVLADGHVFSVHMLEHLLLLLGVSMLVAGAIANLPQEGRLGRLLAAHRTPVAVVGWIAGLSAMWIWHQPGPCSAAFASGSIGVLRDVTLVLAGTLFWLPVFGPAPISPPAGVAYLFSSCIGCTALGVYITFAPISVCPAFAGSSVALRLAQAGFGPSVDQQLGGVLMWVPTCSVYVMASMMLIRRWFDVGSPGVVASEEVTAG